MTRSFDELIRANLLEVFAERDDARRRAVAEEVYAEDVTFTDPEETVTGRAAVEDKARRLLADAPTFVFTPDGEPARSGDQGLLAWGFGPEGADPVVRGVDVSTVAEGRIVRVVTFLTQVPQG